MARIIVKGYKMHSKKKYKMGIETENYEIATKGFENTDFVVCSSSPAVSRQFLSVGYLKGLYKSESSLMTCVAELHCSVTQMPSSILSDMGTRCRRGRTRALDVGHLSGRRGKQ